MGVVNGLGKNSNMKKPLMIVKLNFNFNLTLYQYFGKLDDILIMPS
jgi:hypothetical protein